MSVNFNNPQDSSDDIALNDRFISTLVGNCGRKEPWCTFKYYPHHLPGETEENHNSRSAYHFAAMFIAPE
jgi:hypothetical protein